MKKLLIAIMITSIVIVFFSSFLQPSAETSNQTQEKCANALFKLGILKGDEKGNLKLADKVTRCEFLTMILRVLNYENNTDTKDIKIEFKDLSPKHWAYNNIKIAVVHNLIKGYDDNTMRPDNFVNFTEALAITIRALGYESKLVGKWPDNVINKSVELKLNRALEIPWDKELTRGEASILIYNSLVVDFVK